MIGAAAARHAADSGRQVTIVGAPEPVDWSSSAGPFGSHYDAGRITRIIDADPIWAEMAAMSIARYEDLEARTGIVFHRRVGLVWLRPESTARAAVDGARKLGADVQHVSSQWLAERFGIHVSSAVPRAPVYEGPPAGFVDPRGLVRAQLAAAAQAGATVIAAAVDRLESTASGVAVHGGFGRVDARNVLLATGAYGASLAGVELDLRPMPRTTVRLELDHRFELPSLIVDQVPHPVIEGVYWVPPARYPDGRVLLKIGGSLRDVAPVASDRGLAAWFQGSGSAREAQALLATVHEFLPNARVLSHDTVPCVVTQTSTGYPYVGWVDDRVAVAVGGNGAAAKSSDEIGRRAASLFEPGSEGRLSPAILEPVLAHE